MTLDSRKGLGQKTADGRKGRAQNIEEPLKSDLDLDPEASARRQALTDQEIGRASCRERV